MIVWTYGIVLLCFISFMFIPTISYAENYTVKVDNKTITIVVKPNNTIIVQQPTISDTHSDKPDNSLVTYGDIFTGSATIAGLFSIGLFATTRFNEATKSISAPLLQASVTLSGFVISIHVLVMLVLALGSIFNMIFYTTIMGLTVLSIAAISGFIGRIISIENRMNRTISTTDDDIDKKFPHQQ